MVPLFGADYQHSLHQIKVPQFYTDLGLQRTLLNPPEHGKIQRLFKAFECFSSIFQGRFNFQESPLNSSTFQACANPDRHAIIQVKTNRQGLIQIYHVVQVLCAFSLTDHGRTYPNSDYSAHLRAVQ